MLVSTLIPTLLHGVILLASPLVLLALASPKRAAMAAALAGYDGATEADQKPILQDVAWYLARRQWLAWAGATLMLLTLLAGCSALATLFTSGGLAGWVATVALWSVEAARWLFSAATTAVASA